ncbi:hypothetical protein FGE12_00035 [Aggregicoccus sp. 17bor-14]|uniref:hypothetical protein n=1 Tax=Myxococcaceae TaxID=31 RepID=UPI00129CCC40|nr:MULTISPECIES: hypothetical protein [Myxococcaceae]MBF5040765.1 hypothetical protein [Simulacricoccus sp. 17bor-14]MRI86553.1 hypothetical protein [Aggregicoccus sp. 17bor-14]
MSSPSDEAPAGELGSLLLRVLPPLHRKVRAPLAQELAERLSLQASLKPSGLRPTPTTLLYEALGDLEAEVKEVEAAIAQLTRRYNEAPDAAARRAVLVAHLEETVEDAAERRKDLRALHRWLGFDALRERLERQRQSLQLEEETALLCLGGLLRTGEVETRLSPSVGAPLARALLELASRSPRPQNQLAAVQALRALVEAHPGVAQGLQEPGPALIALVEQHSASPFLRAEALRVLLRVEPEGGRVLMRQRLQAPFAAGRDFLFRREALELLAPLLPPEELHALLVNVGRADPSEYVRMGLCNLVLALPQGVRLLAQRAGLDAESPEPSPRVRASAVLVAIAALREPGAQAPERRSALSTLLAEVLRREVDPLPLRIACEQVGELAGAVAELPGLATLSEALDGVLSREGLAGPVLEAAAAAAQVLQRQQDGARRAWTRYLARVAAELPVGGTTRIEIDPAPEGLPPLPEQDAWLGAILADLSYAGQGLYAQREGHLLRLWRGDRFARRAWRVWHELRRPAPNKRQAFQHTVGRVIPGPLRAHPGHLDEITQTLVPGERVHVATEGSWGRHLPTVDDLLDLPLGSAQEVRLFSSHGTTTVAPPASLGQRLRNRLRITREYEQFAQLRLASLNGSEPRDRRRYVETLERELGLRVSFTPYRNEIPTPRPLETLFGTDPGAGASGGAAATGALLSGLALVDTGWIAELGNRLLENDSYFRGTSGNGLLALALFTAAIFTVFLVHAFVQRQGVRRTRESIPLCIGGWGTRGKSGTERLKAALFSGLGFDVFAKTTGSEAMFVHSAPGAAPSEFFIFRPYDKATIWEQRDMLELGAKLGTEVFLWECMALQPNFVDLLQNDWMKDDLATLTNAYPDHEDIQGPAGINVASVISQFMPEGGKVVTSEDHFLPLFEETARAKDTTLVHSKAYEAELIPEELLALFPYREHPRNMALVATVAEQLGVPRTRALALMAEHVQPEIGVLKVFPSARVRGRTLTFINGHSANERTGFLNNWIRTGLDAVDPERHPERAVLTVINNRWDRVSRSEVFARIMVEDAPADRHVLIGTNLEGLQKFVRDALGGYLDRVEVVSTDDLRGAPAEGAPHPEQRLAQAMARLKIPRPSVDLFLERVALYARGAGLRLTPSAELQAAVTSALVDAGDTVAVGAVREALASSVGPLLERCLEAEPQPEDPKLPEVLAQATGEEVRTHALYLLARLVVHARLRAALPRPGASDPAGEVKQFRSQFRAAYKALFMEQLVPVPDSHATGDQVIDACARAVAPGLQVSIMGAQNIKGTGLDWVYRWIALDRVKSALESFRLGAPDVRRRALEALEGFEDPGLIDSGLARRVLPALASEAMSAEEAEMLQQLADRARATHEAKLAALQHTRADTRSERLTASLEKVLDYVDSVDRRRLAQMLMKDLVEGRVSHKRAALEMRKLYERQKGGWLRESFTPLAALSLLLPPWLRRTRPEPQPELADSATPPPAQGASTAPFFELDRASPPRMPVPDASGLLRNQLQPRERRATLEGSDAVRQEPAAPPRSESSEEGGTGKK